MPPGASRSPKANEFVRFANDLRAGVALLEFCNCYENDVAKLAANVTSLGRRTYTTSTMIAEKVSTPECMACAGISRVHSDERRAG